MSTTTFRLFLLQIISMHRPHMSARMVSTRAREVDKEISLEDVQNWISGRSFPPLTDRAEIISALERSTRR